MDFKPNKFLYDSDTIYSKPSLKRQKVHSLSKFNNIFTTFDTNENSQTQSNFEYRLPSEVLQNIVEFIDDRNNDNDSQNTRLESQEDSSISVRKAPSRQAAKRKFQYDDDASYESELYIEESTLDYEETTTFQQSKNSVSKVSKKEGCSKTKDLKTHSFGQDGGPIATPSDIENINATPLEQFHLNYNKSNTPKYLGKFVNVVHENRLKRQCLLCLNKYTDLKGFNRHYENKHNSNY